MSIDISKLTIGEAREIAALFGLAAAPRPQSHSLVVGQNVLIRTVTLHYTGKILAITDTDIVLGDAAWIANTGRFADALKTGLASDAEVEPFPSTVVVMRGVIVDCCAWTHELPRTQK